MKPSIRISKAVSHPAKRAKRKGATAIPPKKQPAPANRDPDERLPEDLTQPAGGTTAARHHDGQAATDSGEDALAEDKTALDEAAELEDDERRALARQHAADD